MPTTGPQLRKYRRACEVSTVEVARRMGISRMTLYVLEKSAVVDQDKADLYRQAVRDATVTTDGSAA